MSTSQNESEEERFDRFSKEFNEKVEDYQKDDENAWSFLDNRQQEIMDAEVSNDKKVDAFNGVLAALFNIFPGNNTEYCRVLEKQLKYINRKDKVSLLRIAKDVELHKSGVDIMLYMARKSNKNNK